MKLFALLVFAMLCGLNQGCTPLSSQTAEAQTSSESVSEKIVVSKPITEKLIQSFVASTEADITGALGKNFHPDGIYTYSVGELGAQHSLAETCVSSSSNDTSNSSNETFYDYQCKGIQGSVETLTAQNAESMLHEYSVQVNIPVKELILKKISLKKAVTESSDGSVQIEKDFIELTDFGTETSAIKGVLSLIYFPLEQGQNVNDVEINGSLSTEYNSQANETLVIASKELKRSACGFSSGSIEFSSLSRKFEVRWSACQKWQIHELLK